MNELLLVFFSLTLSGSAVLLAVLAAKRLLGNRVSRRWHYYIWLVVVLRLLVPFAPQWNLVGSLLNRTAAIEQAAAGSSVVAEASPEASDYGYFPQQSPPQPEEDGQPQANLPQPGAAATGGIPWRSMADSLWLFWLLGAFVLLSKKVSGYHAFLGYIKAGCHKVTDEKALDQYRALCKEMGIGWKPPLFVNSLASAPMLVGVFRPFIVLPKMEEDEVARELVLRHELTHYRRGDIFYKWLAQIAVCLHWYNPLGYYLIGQINVDCELSCDEAVIRDMDEDEKYWYGETLLSTIKPDPGYSNAIVSITLNEDLSKLKERLDAIMKFQSKSKLATALSLCLAVVLTLGATVTGVYGAPAPKATQKDAATDYLEKSEIWQSYANSSSLSDKMDFQWPDYIVARLDGKHNGKFGSSIFNDKATTALVTIEKVSGTIGISLEEGGGTVVANLQNLSSGQYRMEVGIPSSTHFNLFFHSKDFVGNILIENIGASNNTTTSSNTVSPQNTIYKQSFSVPGYSGSYTVGEIGKNDDLLMAMINETNTQYIYCETLTSKSPPDCSFKGVEGIVSLWDIIVQKPAKLAVDGTINIDGDFKFVAVHDGKELTALSTNSDGKLVLDLKAGANRIALFGMQASGSFKLTPPAQEGVTVINTSSLWSTQNAGAPTTGKSKSADEAAEHILTFAGPSAWDSIVERLLPYMTNEGIDAAVKLYNKKSNTSTKKASDYYGMDTPSRADSDARALYIINMTGNLIYVEPLLPYMTDEGIEQLYVAYNQWWAGAYVTSPSNVKAPDHYN